MAPRLIEIPPCAGEHGSPPRGFSLHAGVFIHENDRQGLERVCRVRGATDPETGQRYTVKRYESEKVMADESWRHAKITLKPNNPKFATIELTGADDGESQVVAELIEVLGVST